MWFKQGSLGPGRPPGTLPVFSTETGSLLMCCALPFIHDSLCFLRWWVSEHQVKLHPVEAVKEAFPLVLTVSCFCFSIIILQRGTFLHSLPSCPLPCHSIIISDFTTLTLSLSFRTWHRSCRIYISCISGVLLSFTPINTLINFHKDPVFLFLECSSFLSL